MIRKIVINKVASYKAPTTLEADKKINLIYGLNGTGKSTLSNFLYNTENPIYNQSFLERDGNEEILVYNQEFIKDIFFEDDNLNGVFSLSKENKDAKQRIKNAQDQLSQLENQKQEIVRHITSIKEKLETSKHSCQDNLWEIKQKHTGGDRVLEYCFPGLKQKAALMGHLLSIQKPDLVSIRSIDEIKKEIQSLNEISDEELAELSIIKSDFARIESDEIFDRSIVGSNNSTVSKFIEELGNSDWIRKGLKYIDFNPSDNQRCPFCQEYTIDEEFKKSIQEFYNEVYERDLENLLQIHEEYKGLIEDIPPLSYYDSNQFVIEYLDEFKLKYSEVNKILISNENAVQTKLNNPSAKITLESSSQAVIELNDLIKEINIKIVDLSQKLNHKRHSLQKLKDEFWTLMRYEYDGVINTLKTSENLLNTDLQDKEIIQQKLNDDILNQNRIISEEQKNTVNIEEAAENIKQQLLDLGITDFTISKETESTYKIIRGNDNDKIFRSLSEGEKMIISFLYFMELCKGKMSADQGEVKKIIVIDDPISNLSHVHVFNVGRLILNELFNGQYDQIFVLTHSLYFFYELTDIKKERRDKNQSLFRLVKNENGSFFSSMKYEEIQNDYQAYWSIINDNDQSPALIANCMRNIIEYFFNFIEKRDFNNVSQKPELNKTKFHAFFRYMNRESHSLGQNIFDIKEFDYDTFKEALRLVFETSGYEEHYNRMTK